MNDHKESFHRDARSPIPKDVITSKVMRSNKRKDTKPELLIRKMLRDCGYGGYRIQWDIPGRPDICYPGKKVAIFVNGCYWHRCPQCNLPLPKNNSQFWMKKFEKNVERDEKNVLLLEKQGWIVHIAWECEIRKNVKNVINTVTRNL